MPLDTRTQLLAHAERAVRRHGYAGFSYADLTDAVGIRKASIHHHFPAKQDLAVALVEVYTARFQAALADIVARASDAADRLAAYAGLYRAGLAAGQGCLCGVLASELATLPERVQAGVRRFFAVNLAWLADTIEAGRQTGAFRTDIAPPRQAAAVLAGLQGAMLIGQALGDATAFDVAAFDHAAAAVLAGLQRTA